MTETTKCTDCNTELKQGWVEIDKDFTLWTGLGCDKCNKIKSDWKYTETYNRNLA